MDSYHIFSGNKANSVGRSIKKSSTFKNPVIIINGFNGSGKTLVAPIVASLPKVEIMSFAYPIEWVSSIFYANEMSVRAYQEFVKMFVDESIYNQQMSRSVNFRYSDLSSVFKSTKKFQYIQRLFKKGDDAVVPIIRNEKPISCFTTCHLLPLFPSLSSALRDRLLFIETIRDPLLMFEQLSILGSNILDKNSEKDFTFKALHNDISRSYLDFYSNDDIFLNEKSLSHEENLINYIYRMFDFYFNYEIRSDITKSKLIFIPFEDFALNPDFWIKKVSTSFGLKIDNKTKAEMKKQSVPRKLLSHGLKLPIYKKYGSEHFNVTSLEEEREMLISKNRKLFKDPGQFDRLLEISKKYHDWKSSFMVDD